MSINTKQQVLEYLKKQTSEINWDDMMPFSAITIAGEVEASRSVISQYLNEFHSEGKIVKVNTRPVYFLHKKTLYNKHDALSLANTYDSLAELQQVISADQKKPSAFAKLVGAKDSLSYCVEQCKAAISYPNGGLPILLHGETGTGKTMIAQLLYEYAVQIEAIDKDKRFITVNCSEYANNPELFLTNLFGNVKGAYTGADDDKVGLISLVDGGILFLDEVHSLKPECQEKIFLFMDKGIYHMVGDNDTWYHSSARIIFATTEAPDTVLLKTLLRRIPVIVNIPSLQERPIHEKRCLISKLLREEEKDISCPILVSNLAYQALEIYPYSGNVGELKNVLRSSVAKAFLRDKLNEVISIHMYDLPVDILQHQSVLSIMSDYDDKQMLDIHMIQNASQKDSKLFQFHEFLIEQIIENNYQTKPFFESTFSKLEKYIDFLFFSDEVPKGRQQLSTTILTNLIEIINQKYNLERLSNNEISSLVRFLQDYAMNESLGSNLYRKNKAVIHSQIEVLKQSYPMDYSMVNDLCQLLENSFNLKNDPMLIIDLFVFCRYFHREVISSQIPGIIIAHGYSIASGIAEVANQLLKQRVFEALDMPIESDFEDIVVKLKEYLKMMEGCREIIVMVDMGSLEDIHEYLECFEQMEIGIINNVTTKLALDIGSMIMVGEPISTILEEASERNKHNFVIVDNKVKKDAILSVCETGTGTAEKISHLIENSFPTNLDISIVPYDYDRLMVMGSEAPIFDKYNISFIVGTREMQIGDIPFISIEELIEQHSLEKINTLFSNYMNENEIQIFNENMVKNFSLDNLVGYLTILDSKRIIDNVEEIIKEIQNELHIEMNSGIVFGLFIHISCLIERLIIDKYIIKFNNLEVFEKENQEFINVVKHSFRHVEESYNVKIPVSEIGYLHRYIFDINDTPSVEEHLGSVEKRQKLLSELFDEEEV